MKNLISFFLIGILLCSCSSINKHKTFEQSKKDSSTVKVNDIVTDTKKDSTSETKTITAGESVINIEFIADTTKDSSVVTISTINGEIKINAGKKKIKSIAATTKNLVDSSRKTNTSTKTLITDKTKQETSVKTKIKASEVSVKKIRWPSVLIMLFSGGLFYLIFILYKKYKKAKDVIT